VDVTEFLLYLYAESPVHTGAADSADVLDLPVQREVTTGYPVIWGQSLKGALRQAARDNKWPRERLVAVFGSEPEEPGEDRKTTPGALSVGDAQLVAMPVPTLRKTFAWLTSDIALGRVARKYSVLHRPTPPVPQVSPDAGLAAGSEWVQADSEVLGPCVVPLGDAPDQRLIEWANRLADDALGTGGGFAPFAGKLRTDLVLAGTSITPILLRECTEQAVRVQLAAKSKTVQNGPFYSEYLPAETILAAALTLRGNGDTADHQAALRELLHGKLLQIGGDETLGKGLAWGRLLEAAPPGTPAQEAAAS
jgi:CRISPR-associated protein Cmr4